MYIYVFTQFRLSVYTNACDRDTRVAVGTRRAFQFAIRIDSIRFVKRIDSNRFVF